MFWFWCFDSCIYWIIEACFFHTYRVTIWWRSACTWVLELKERNSYRVQVSNWRPCMFWICFLLLIVYILNMLIRKFCIIGFFLICTFFFLFDTHCMDACHTMQAYIEIDWNLGSNPFEYSLSQSSNHVLLITLDPYPLNCPFLPLLFSIFCIKTYRISLVWGGNGTFCWWGFGIFYKEFGRFNLGL